VISSPARRLEIRGLSGPYGHRRRPQRGFEGHFIGRRGRQLAGIIERKADVTLMAEVELAVLEEAHKPKELTYRRVG
jgi:hypothetical protein